MEVMYLTPKNHQDFEAFCQKLFQYEIDEKAERYGRSGQTQHGVDIYCPITKIAVQCKHIEYGKTLTVKTVQEELSKTNGFPNEIKKYIIITTSRTEAKVQDFIWRPEIKNHTFQVEVWFWEDRVTEIINKHPQLQQMLSNQPSFESMINIIEDPISKLALIGVYEEKDPKNKTIINEKIKALEKLGKHEAVFDIVLKQSTNLDDINHLHNLVWVYESKDDIGKLKEIGDLIIKKNDNDGYGWYALLIAKAVKREEVKQKKDLEYFPLILNYDFNIANRERRFEDALSIVNKILKKKPDKLLNLKVFEVFSHQLTIITIIKEHTLPYVPRSKHKDIKQAIAHLENDEMHKDDPSILNALGLSYDILGDFHKARSIYEKAIELEKNENDKSKYITNLLFNSIKMNSGTIELIDKYNDYIIQYENLMTISLGFLLDINDKKINTFFTDETLKKIDSIKQRNLIYFFQVLSLSDNQQKEKAKEILLTLEKNTASPSDLEELRIFYLKVVLYSFDEPMKNKLNKLIHKEMPIDNKLILFNIALELWKKEEFSIAMNTMEGLYNPKKWDTFSKQLLFFYNQKGTAQQILELVENIKREGNYPIHILYYELKALSTLKQYDDMIPITEKLLKEYPDDIELKISYVHLLSLGRQIKKLTQHLADMKDIIFKRYDVISVEKIILISHLYAEVKDLDFALRLIYKRCQVDRWKHQGIYEAFFHILMKEKSNKYLSKKIVNNENHTVTMEFNDNKETVSFTLETDEVLTENDIDKNDSKWKLLIDKKLNEPVDFGARTLTIIDIKHKYVHLYQEIPNKLEKYFPENPAIRTIPILDPNDPLSSLEKFLKPQIENYNKQQERSYEAYKQGDPVFLYSYGNNSILRSMEEITKKGFDLTFLESEYIKIPQKQKIFLDTTAIYTLFLLGIQNELFNLDNDIYISDNILEEVKKYCIFKSNNEMLQWSKKIKIYNPEIVEYPMDVLKDPNKRRLLIGFEARTLKEEWLWWNDDAHHVNLMGKKETFNTLSFLNQLLSSSIIDEEKYINYLASLIKNNYKYIFLNIMFLLKEIKLSNYKVSDRFKILTSSIKDMKPEYQLIYATLFLKKLYLKNSSVEFVPFLKAGDILYFNSRADKIEYLEVIINHLKNEYRLDEIYTGLEITINMNIPFILKEKNELLQDIKDTLYS